MIFLLWEFTSIEVYANYVNKFSFVLYTNMAEMQTTYMPGLVFFCSSPVAIDGQTVKY